VPAKPSALVDTRVIYCGDNLEQLRKLPDGCMILGAFVGFEFTDDAPSDIDRFRRKEGRQIRPLMVREILEEEIAQRSGR
jgi:hypothetical protein